MRIVVRSGADEQEVDVELRSPEATLGDLVAALGPAVPPCDHRVRVDGRALPASCAVVDAGLLEGGVLELAPPAFVPAGAAPAEHEVAVVAGPLAGATWPLSDTATLGRDPACDIVLPSLLVSRQHCALVLDDAGVVRVTDLGARNPAEVDGLPVPPHGSCLLAPGAVLRVGPHALVARRRAAPDRPVGLDLRRQAGPAGTVAFNRPPRPAAPPLPEPLPLPEAPAEPTTVPFGVAAVLGPLVLAAVMVAVTRDPRFALFSALSPVLGVGTWYESRRRGSRTGRLARRRYAGELDELRAALDRAADAERDRRRECAPDPAELLRRAALPSTRLWERRPATPDFLRVGAGCADQPWAPPVAAVASPRPPEVAALLGAAQLTAAPVLVDLSAGGVVGLVGDRGAALATARALLCAVAVTSGPADVTIAVCADPGREPDWSWCGWLPHTRSATGRWLSADRDSSEVLLRELTAGAAAGTAVVVLDGEGLTAGRAAPARDLLRLASRRRDAGPEPPPPVAGIVVAATADALPAACDQVLVVAPDGSAVLRRLRDGTQVTGVLTAALSERLARRCARDLARFEDPELGTAAARLPRSVRLLPLLDLPRLDAEHVRKHWRSAGTDPGARAPVGVHEHGVLELDLVRDGAHGLVGGTTGSGKSELLRTLVAGLAVSADPQHLAFVLVDYKGGAAFDACRALPHVVGVVTDLDEQLGARALRSLEAELRRRERTLRAAGADSLPDYLALGLPEPVPRLVVVVDEFATLAAELPGFVSSLVGIAQRGRTLGVHLLLATQRPSGVVSDDIRANTNLRVALRVQDAADSVDVLGVADAASLRRDAPGRAYVRLGPGELVALQTALVTCDGSRSSDERVAVAPAAFGSGRVRAEDLVPAAPGRSDLARLVAVVREAADAEGASPPRRPWLEPLPHVVDLAGLLCAGRPGTGAPVEPVVAVALADDPGAQAQYPAGWDLAAGGLLLLGLPGSGTTTTLVAVALALAADRPPTELELFGLDAGVGDLAALEALPHTGAVVPAGDTERAARLLRQLGAELDRRRSRPRDAWPRTVLLVDNLPGLRAGLDDVAGLELVDLLARLLAEGPEVGISTAVTADRSGAVPLALSSVTPQRWLFRLADPYDYTSAGLGRTDVPAPVPGRAVLLPAGLQAQVGLPEPELLADVAARWAGSARRARPVATLPGRVAPGALGLAARLDDEVWRLPVGIAESDLGVAVLALHEGEAALVAGPARSGRSSVLAALAATVRAGLPDVHVVASGGRRSPLASCSALHEHVPAADVPALVARLRVASGPTLLLLDDAETFEDTDGALEGLLAAAPPGLRVVAAGRCDALRPLYGHWTARVRRSRTGLLLKPDVDLDGDLLGIVLPRRAPVALSVARGYLVADGVATLVQAATPD